MKPSPVDHIRHATIVPVKEWGRREIHFIGNGAVGSIAAKLMAKMMPYVSCLHCWDFDFIESQNVPNTEYKWYQSLRRKEDDPSAPDHIPATKKVDALKLNIAMDTYLTKEGIQGVLSGEMELDPDQCIQTHDEKVGWNEDHEIDGEVVFLMVDCMDARKAIVNHIAENCPYVKLIIEGRLGDATSRIYTFNPQKKEEVEFWMKNWYPNKKEDPSICSHDPTVPHLVYMLVGRMVLQFSDWADNKLRGAEHTIEPELILRFRDFGVVNPKRKVTVIG